MTQKRLISAFLSVAMAIAIAFPVFSQNDYNVFLDSLKTNVNRQVYGQKWHRGGYKHRVPYRHIVSTPVAPDSADIAYHQKKNFWRAGAEVVGLNISLWAFDRYVKHGDYAYISWETIKENFKHGFEWDNDHLITNMFAHPYNGSIFFNAGRSNGFNFWQSELFAIGGSAMWEMCMEREYPSTNDIIATPIGGAAIGEVLYRASDLVLDDSSTGSERFGREAAAFILDPMRGINRIVTGQAWKKRSSSGRRFGLPPISVELSVGPRLLAMIDNNGFKAGATSQIHLEYGDRFELSTKVPYDYFSFLLEAQMMKTQPLLGRIEIIGRLLSKEIIDEDRLNMNVGMYQHFDYFDSDTIRNLENDEIIPENVPYKFGTPASFGIGSMIRYIPNSKMSVDGFAHFNVVALAGVLTDLYRGDDERNYSWGGGYSAKVGFNWAMANDKISIKIANQFYHIFTRNNFQSSSTWMIRPNSETIQIEGGDNGVSTFNHFEADVNFKLKGNLYFTEGFDIYNRHTYYKDMVLNVANDYEGHTRISDLKWNSKQIGAHIMLTYKF